MRRVLVYWLLVQRIHGRVYEAILGAQRSETETMQSDAVIVTPVEGRVECVA